MTFGFSSLLLPVAAAEADDREFVYIELGNLVPKIIIIRFSSSRLSSTSFFLFFVLTCNRVLPGFVWDASGLMGLAADVGASRNAPVIPRLLQLFPTPTLGRCLSTLVAAAQHSVPSPLRWSSPQKPLALSLLLPRPSSQVPDPIPHLNAARGGVWETVWTLK